MQIAFLIAARSSRSNAATVPNTYGVDVLADVVVCEPRAPMEMLFGAAI